MTDEIVFKGVDYAELILVINGELDPDEENEVTVRKLVTEENISTLRHFLSAHISHNKKCANGRTDDNPVFEALLNVQDEFTFLKLFYALVPLMWC
jgi:hypothetical protein